MGNTTPTKFNKKTTAIEAANNIDLTGKIALVTGCNTGIGKETARVLAIQGAKVYMLCRNMQKANAARDDLIKSIKSKENKTFDENKLIIIQLDLSSLLSIRRCVGKFLSLNEPIDFLICNAGVMAIPEFQASTDGYEMQFAINHLGHFYLALLLTPILLSCTPCRIIVLASTAHSASPKIDKINNFITDGIKKKNGPIFYTSMIAKGYENYGLSKACNILFAREYNRRYCKQGIICVSLHPGVINTQLFKTAGNVTNFFMSIGSTFLKSIQQGAATTIRCVTMNDSEIYGGHYYKDCNEANALLRNDLKPFRGVVQKIETKIEKKTDENEAKTDCNDKDEKQEEKKDINSMEYKLWEWSELLITEKGFKLDMIGFEQEEKERLEKEAKEKIEKEKEKKESDVVSDDKKEEEQVIIKDDSGDVGDMDEKEDDKSDKVEEVNKVDVGNEENVKDSDEVVEEQNKEKVKQDVE